MFADTDAIRALAAANAACADDLAEIVEALSSLPVAASGSSLGPVASRFLSALAAAAADGARAVAAISDQLTSAGEITNTVASAYDSADTSAAGRVEGG
jgi:hypothetical protein